MRELFRRFAHAAAEAVGSPAVFLVGVVGIVVWIISGPYFHYSDTWQLVVNTSTSVITFLVVFLIQNTQNRDAKVMQLKLDELIRAVTSARTELVQMEELSDSELEVLQKEFLKYREHAAAKLEQIETSRKKRKEQAREGQPAPGGKEQEVYDSKN
jgi:low affinity Fe/Cu permease